MVISKRSLQYLLGEFEWNSRVLHVKRCLCFLSATPFCYGVSTQVVWCKMPLDWKNSFGSSLVPNSKALSDLITLTLVENCLSTRDKKFCKVENALDLADRRNVHVHLEKSSTIVKKNLSPL